MPVSRLLLATFSPLSQLRALQEGQRPEDIAITQAQVDNKKAALEAGEVLTACETAESNLVSEREKLEKIKTQAIVGLSGQLPRQTAPSPSSCLLPRQLACSGRRVQSERGE